MAGERARRPLAAVLALTAAVAVAACSLDEEGEGGLVGDAGGIGGSSAGDAFFPGDSTTGSDITQPPNDAGLDVPISVDVVVPLDVTSEPLGPCSAPIGACVASVPGWEVVAFAVAPSAACPTGF